MLKSSKRYAITTNALNSQGFRILSEGLDWRQYKGNPIMLYMHFRPTGRDKNEVRALGNVRDVEIGEDGVPYGYLYFNDKYDFAKDIYEGYENGTYNMVSIGVLPLEYSTDPNDLLPGQSFATVTKGIVKEISCVDIGSNAEALGVALYDHQGNIITLSDNLKINSQNIEKMKILTLSADSIGLLKLAEGATPEQAHEAIQNLITLADSRKTEVETLKTDKATLATEKLALETKLADAVTLAATEKLEALVDQAVTDRKITADQKPDFIKLSFEVAKPILDKMVASPTVASQLDKQTATGDKALLTMSYRELDKAGKLLTLKAQDFEVFKTKFKEEYNTDYAGAQ